jgi:hypothetical protein
MFFRLKKGYKFIIPGKIYRALCRRSLSDGKKTYKRIVISAGDSNTDAKTVPNTSVDTLGLTDIESDVAMLLDSLVPGILSTDESIVQRPLPADVLEKLFARDVKFADKVELVKGYLCQPLRTKLVEQMPTHETQVVRFSPEKQTLVELLYVLRCIAGVLPDFKPMIESILASLGESGVEAATMQQIDELRNLITKMRGISASVSAVAAAALKVYYTVDGMAFDDFSMSLTAFEWEQITQNMNEVRLQYADRIRQLQDENYQLHTSKHKRVNDKRALDSDMNAARIPLVRIHKLTLDDLHHVTQTQIFAKLSIAGSDKKLKYDRKAHLASVKQVILTAYRKDPNLDVLLHAKETPIEI